MWHRNDGGSLGLHHRQHGDGTPAGGRRTGRDGPDPNLLQGGPGGPEPRTGAEGLDRCRTREGRYRHQRHQDPWNLEWQGRGDCRSHGCLWGHHGRSLPEVRESRRESQEARARAPDRRTGVHPPHPVGPARRDHLHAARGSGEILCQGPREHPRHLPG